MKPASVDNSELGSLCIGAGDAEPAIAPQACSQSAHLHRGRIAVASLLLLGGVVAACLKYEGAAGRPRTVDLRGGHVLLAASAPVGYIFVVRHAERDTSVSCLNATGWTRAGNLSSGLFLGGARPERIFAYNYNGGSCERCLQTALPLATALQLDINHSFPQPGMNCYKPAPCPGVGWKNADKEAADAMLAALDETGGPIFTVWESMNTIDLLKHLGVQDAPTWPYGNCALEYNRMYKLSCTKSDSQWECSSYESLTEGMPCLSEQLASEAEMVGAVWPPLS